MSVHVKDVLWFQIFHNFKNDFMIFKIEIVQSFVKPVALMIHADW